MNNCITDELLKWDREHIMHPFYPVGQHIGIILEQGKGVILRDTAGKEYIDLGSQLVCVNLGYGRREITDAVAKQMSILPYITAFYGYSSQAIVECSRKLAEIVPQGLDHFMFTSGGSESTETAFKLARTYWRNRGKSNYKIISLYNSYHGATLGSLTCTGLNIMWVGAEPVAPGFQHIPGYYCYRCTFGLEYPSCNMRCARFLAETIEFEGPETVAAFIAEPVQGVGGSIAPPPEYWPIVRDICTKYSVLLIADEVMSGFGRTGKMFALENWGVKPDMMTLAKGITSSYLPFGVVATNNEIYDSFKDKPGIATFTNSGHPVCAAAATAAMGIYASEKVIENVAKVGKHTLKRLHADFEPLPCVGAIHGMGLFLSIELVTDKKAKTMMLGKAEDVRRKGRENGILVRVAGGNKIQVAPPLVITAEEVDRGLDRLLPIVASLK